ncbi:cytochrome P450 [Nemania sp. FL0031]|nr:cytochrome P450 [Nemania sp. FL0031]
MESLLAREPSSLLKFTIGLLLIYLLASSCATWHRLRHFRGPFIAQFSYLYMLRVLVSGDHGKRYRDLSDRYDGDALLRIGPNDILASSPAMIRHMNSARSLYMRSDWYLGTRLDPSRDILFSQPDPAQHDKLKAQLAPGYGGKENPTLEAGVDEQLQKLVALIRRKYISTATEFRPLDLATISMFFTIDTISRIAFGEAFGYLDKDIDIHGFEHFAEAAVKKTSIFSEIPWLGKIFFYPPVLRLFAPRATDKKGVGVFIRIADEVVKKRSHPDAEDKKDMLGSFLRHGVSPQQCQPEIIAQIFGGTDTAAYAIRATMLNVMTSPHVYARLQAEIDAAIANGRIRSRPAKAEEVQQLPYMQAVVREGLRFNPPSTGLFSKQVPAEGDTFDGRFLPGGTRVAVNIIAIQRSKEVFGQDADVFRPERWLEASSEKHREMSQTVDQVFGWGRWQCLGKPIAMLELNKVFVELLRYFDFQVVNPESPWKNIDYTVYVVSDFWVRVTERPSSL